MKKHFLVVAFLMAGLAVSAQNNAESDTTVIKLGDSRIVIFKDSGSDSDVDFNFTEKDSANCEEEEEWIGYFDAGMAGYMGPNFDINLPADQGLMELNYGKSRSFSLSTMYKGLFLVKDRLYLSPGIGISWSNYSFKNNINISTGSEQTSFSEALDRTYDKHKLRVTYLQVPLVLGLKMGNPEKPFGVQVGVIGSIKLGSSIKQKYTFEDAKYKEKIKDDYNINPFKFETIARINIGAVAVYGKYSLTPLFEKNKAPELNPFSVGLTLAAFKNMK